MKYSEIDLGAENVVINGVKVKAALRAHLYHDDAVDLSFLEGKELLNMRRKIANGTVVPTVIIVLATAKDCIEGSDVLGGCFLYGQACAIDSINEHEMRETAIKAMVDNTVKAASRMAKFSKVKE